MVSPSRPVMTDADVEERLSRIIEADKPIPHIHRLAADLRWERDMLMFDAAVHIAVLLAKRLRGCP